MGLLTSAEDSEYVFDSSLYEPARDRFFEYCYSLRYKQNKLFSWAKKVGDGIPNVIQYDQDVAAASFDRIDDLFADLDLFPKLGKLNSRDTGVLVTRK